MKMRFATLLKNHGPVHRATALSEADWQRAVTEGRFATVYHGESDWCTPLLAVVRHHGCVNTLCKITFARPLPAGVDEIIGLRDNDDAWTLCNPQ
jgi:hypothetical protein